MGSTTQARTAGPAGASNAVAARRVSRGSAIQAYRSRPELAAAAAELADASISENTRRAYASDIRQLQRWLAGYIEGDTADPAVLEATSTCPLSPGTVVQYLTEKSLVTTETGGWRYAPSSMTRWLAAIARDHIEHGFESPTKHPTVQAVLVGIRRKHARPRDQSAPLLLDGLRQAVLAADITSFPAGVRGTRDIAVLVLGFAGAFRRSELTNLTLGDITLHDEDGLHVRVVRSKTDQEQHGAIKGLPFGANSATCPPCAFRRWYALLVAAGEGRPQVMRALRTQNIAVHLCRDPFVATLPRSVALFPALTKNGFPASAGGDPLLMRGMSGDAVAKIVKERARNAGLPAEALSGHSLRAGFITQAIRAGASHHQIMRQSMHKNPATVEIYVRENAPLEQNAVTMIGL
ncbi:site-specific integrase [Frondihabitans sp. PAMC 28766]|uniref:site-specific integrase n=1 Tax=Frondihabitans sp. PAMC 28766 TaxID=1795630 RepID=UPI0012FF8814|nr:site-specific integrase [Frondihabitans sp. PAMC 28766]